MGVKLVSPGHWAHLPQARGWSQFPDTLQVHFSLSPECRSQLSSEAWVRFSNCSIQREAKPSKSGAAQYGPLISSRTVSMAPAVTQDTDIQTDNSCSWTMDSAMVLSSSSGLDTNKATGYGPNSGLLWKRLVL